MAINTIQHSECQIDQLQIKASHQWYIPNFGIWVDENKTWLDGPTFSPFQGIQLQIKILKTSDSKPRVFLRNLNENPVHFSSCSLKFIAYPTANCIHLYPNLSYTHYHNTELKESFTLALSEDWPLEWPLAPSNPFWKKDCYIAAPKHEGFDNILKITCSLVLDVSRNQMGKPVNTVSKAGIRHALAKQLLEPSFTDWTLICEGEELACHRVLLASQSPVFERMFQQSGFQESKTCKTEINDINLRTLKALIRFLYTETLDVVNDDFQALFACADKYNIKELSSACENLLVQKLTVSNALELFLLAELHQGQVLKGKAKEKIAANFKTIKTSEQWKELRNDPSSYPAILEITDCME